MKNKAKNNLSLPVGTPPSIFKEYDIRGRYPKEVNEKIVAYITERLASYFKTGIIVVGHDARRSAKPLYKVTLKNLSRRQKVIAVGRITTPMLYFLVYHLKAQGGIMVTASHNPKDWIGLKVVGKNVDPISGKEIEEIIKNTPPLNSGSKHPPKKKKYYREYADFLRRNISPNQPLKVVFDCSSGTTGIVLKELFKGAGRLKPYFINKKPDGNFPAHAPNPLAPGARAELKKAVKKKKADLGVIFDADGDRVAFIDDKGQSIDSDYIVYLLSQVFKPPYLIDVAEGKAPLLWISKNIKLIESVVGHYFVKKEMHRHKLEFGAEHSGHYYFKKFNYNDSGIMAALAVMQEVSRIKKEGRSLSEWLKALPQHYSAPEAKLHVKDFEKLVGKLEKHYKKRAKRVSHKDGITVEFDDIWFNIRPSHTESVVRLNIEAKSKNTLKKMLTMLDRETKVK